MKKIKDFFYRLSLNKALKNATKIQREMINIDKAKSIGILFNATKHEDVRVVFKFSDKLRANGKQVYILGFQNIKSKEESGPKTFNRNSVNWYGVPSDAKIDGFVKIPKDILICAFKEECLPLEYIAARSKAKFRVGAFSQLKTNFYELMINIKPEQKLIYLLQQTLHFLKVINKNDQ